jgi:hypothetical protein
MTDLAGIGRSLKTPFTFSDNSRPLAMVDADNIFKRLQLKYGDTTSDALQIVDDVVSVLENTKASEVDQLWERLEKKLNDGRPISTKAKTDNAKATTAFSLIYSALTVIDSKAVSTAELSAISDMFFDVDLKFSSKIVSKMEGTEKRTGLRASDTIRKRIDAMTERFNELVEAGELAGQPL